VDSQKTHICVSRDDKTFEKVAEKISSSAAKFESGPVGRSASKKTRSTKELGKPSERGEE
jgi:hypothetical protein